MSLFLKHAATHSFFLSSSSLLSSGLTSPNAANFARLLQTETRLQSWAALPLASRQQVIKMIGPDHAAAPRRRQEPAEAEAADAVVLTAGWRGRVPSPPPLHPAADLQQQLLATTEPLTPPPASVEAAPLPLPDTKSQGWVSTFCTATK